MNNDCGLFKGIEFSKNKAKHRLKLYTISRGSEGGVGVPTVGSLQDQPMVCGNTKKAKQGCLVSSGG